MTAPDLRDQMAMAALTGFIARGLPSWVAAKEAYIAADYALKHRDAMLAQRARTTEGEER